MLIKNTLNYFKALNSKQLLSKNSSRCKSKIDIMIRIHNTTKLN